MANVSAKPNSEIFSSLIPKFIPGLSQAEINERFQNPYKVKEMARDIARGIPREKINAMLIHRFREIVFPGLENGWDSEIKNFLNGDKTRLEKVCELTKNDPNLLKITLVFLKIETDVLSTTVILLRSFYERVYLDEESKKVSERRIQFEDKSFLALDYKPQTIEGFAVLVQFTKLHINKFIVIIAQEKDRKELENYLAWGNEEVKKYAQIILNELQKKENTRNWNKQNDDFFKAISPFQAKLKELNEKDYEIVKQVVPALSLIASIFSLYFLFNLKKLQKKEEISIEDYGPYYLAYDKITKAIIKASSQEKLYGSLHSMLSGLAPKKSKIVFFKKYLAELITVKDFSKKRELLRQDIVTPKKDEALQQKQQLQREIVDSDEKKEGVKDVPKQQQAAAAKPDAQPLVAVAAQAAAAKAAAIAPKMISGQLKLKPFPYPLRWRVKRWFGLKLDERIPFPEYSNNKDHEKAIIHHAFSKAVDHFIHDQEFCLTEDVVIKNQKRKIFHLVAQFEYANRPMARGRISYAINENNVCFHRCFSVTDTANFLTNSIDDMMNNIEQESVDEINEEDATLELNDSQVIFEKHPLFGFIRIKDKINNIMITLYKQK